MKSCVKKYGALMLALVIICSVCLLFCTRKEGMFIDEIYSYGLANSYYAPYVTNLKMGNMIDKVFTRDELVDYLAVMDDDWFAAGSVYYNQTMDVHPPLYYWLLNFASSLCVGHFSMWIGLILNLIIYVITLILLYKLGLLLFDSRLNAVSAVLLYGLSTIGLSTMLMIRMYMLLTLFTVLLAYLIAHLMRTKRLWLCPAIGVTVFCGLMTQYYYVFYAFFVCGAYVIYALVKKEWRALLTFAGCALAGALCLLFAFPACIDQLFADALVSGGSAVENLKSVWQYAQRLNIFIGDSTHRMKGIIYSVLIIAAACVVGCKGIAAAWREKRIKLDVLVLALPAAVSFVVVAIISPVSEIRYIYNIVPMLLLFVCLLLHLAENGIKALKDNKKARLAVGVAVALIALWQARSLAPDYLFDEYSDYDALLAAHSDAPCVYIDDNYFSPITFDMLQLMCFDDFLVTNDTASDTMLNYIGNAEETVVFIDISKQWASGYDDASVVAQLEESTGYTDAEKLYSNGFSAVYLLSR